MLDRLIEAKIVPWKPGFLGISLRFASGHVTTYSVGDLRDANEELSRLTGNGRLAGRGHSVRTFGGR
jgi:hypothetical protein